MTGLQDLLALSDEVIRLHFLVFLRLAPALALFPGFGERTLSVRIKLVAALMMTIIVTPAILPSIRSVLGAQTPLVWIVISETLVGLLLGLGVRLFVLALQTAGTVAAQATSLSQITGTAGVEPTAALGHVLVLGGLALAMSLGLHVQLAETLILTYTLFPVANMPDPSAVSEWGVRQVASAFALAFSLAAPFVIVSLLYNLTLGIINRAMPQMMVVFVGAPVITGAGLALLLLLAPTMLTLWAEALSGFLSNPFGGR